MNNSFEIKDLRRLRAPKGFPETTKTTAARSVARKARKTRLHTFSTDRTSRRAPWNRPDRYTSPVPERKGLFLVLEGADGCGKTTQAKRLVAALGKGRSKKPLHVRDPGGTRLSEAVRAILLDRAQDRLTVEAETLLYVAARAQLAAEVIAPALAAGRVVVCERWTLSTEVYQGLAGGFGAARVRRLVRLALGDLEPDLSLVLDVAVGGGLARLRRERDRVESKGDDFHALVVKGYRRLAAGRARCAVIPPGDEREVAARVLAEVRPHVG